MIIITGIGRSGTSALAQYAKACGKDIGETTWNEEADAGLEDHETLVINNLIRKGRDYGNRIQEVKADVVKDPQFVSDPKIIKAWWDARKDLTVLYCHRNYYDIASSQKRKGDMYGPAYRCFPDLMEKKEDDFISTCYEIGIDLHVLSYPYGDLSFEFAEEYLGGNRELWDKTIRSSIPQ